MMLNFIKKILPNKIKKMINIEVIMNCPYCNTEIILVKNLFDISCENEIKCYACKKIFIWE